MCNHELESYAFIWSWTYPVCIHKKHFIDWCITSACVCVWSIPAPKKHCLQTALGTTSIWSGMLKLVLDSSIRHVLRLFISCWSILPTLNSMINKYQITKKRVIRWGDATVEPEFTGKTHGKNTQAALWINSITLESSRYPFGHISEHHCIFKMAR